MALIFPDLSLCPLCGRVISSSDPYVAFPAFVLDPEDPLFRYSDGVFHEECFRRCHDSAVFLARLAEWTARTGPGKRKCAHCGAEIMEPDDCLLIDYLCEPQEHAAGAFNYTYLHRSHLQAWPLRAELVNLLQDARSLGIVSANYADQVLAELKDKPA